MFQPVPVAPVAPQAPTDPAVAQLNALSLEQVLSVTRLVNLESRRVELDGLAKTASGKDLQAVRSQLDGTIAAIAGEKAKIENLKVRIKDLQGEAPRGFATIGTPAFDRPAPRRMFGMQKDEFMSIFMLLITMPIVLAVSSRLWRRAPVRQASIIDDERLARLEQAVESVAIEVERIGESQRFQSKLMVEKQRVPAREESTPRVPTPV